VLTRVEIDGFKSFENFSIDLQPFTVIAGPNAAGKSNFFDALRLLSRLCQFDVRNAFQEIRGDSAELFRRSGEKISNTITISVEVLLPNAIEDSYGLGHELKHNRVRYSIAVERRIEAGSAFDRLHVVSESATPIIRSEDRWFKGSRPPSQAFRKKLRSSRKSSFLDTTRNEAGEPIFMARQDRTQGRGRHFPAARAETSVLSGITSAAEFPHLYALRTLLSDIRYLQLDPTLERGPASFLAPERLEPNGSNLAAVLAKLKAATKTPDNPNGIIKQITQALRTIVPSVSDLNVVTDDIRREHRIEICTSDGDVFSSRVISDGTLRIISLLALIYDLNGGGVVCFEEPENGIHEFRIKQLIEIIRHSCIDFQGIRSAADQELIQFIVNTHSPIVLKNLMEYEVIYADTVMRISKGQAASRSTRMRSGASRSGDDRQLSLTRFEIDALLHQGSEGA
jgi:predicted ATPase